MPEDGAMLIQWRTRNEKSEKSTEIRYINVLLVDEEPR